MVTKLAGVILMWIRIIWIRNRTIVGFKVSSSTTSRGLLLLVADEVGDN